MNIYQKITKRIIEELESGVVPWQKPWRNIHNDPFNNPVSGTVYSGMNIFLLAMFTRHQSARFVTYKQAKKAGGSVRKGESGIPITFFTFISKEAGKWVDASDDPEADRVPVLKGYTVFNIEQCEGLPQEWYETEEIELNEIQQIEKAEQIVQAYPNPPKIEETLSNRAFYRRSNDTVTMPERGQFGAAEAFYSVLFHELAHSTGHATRLSREGITEDNEKGGRRYGEEELIAELAASYLCGVAGFAEKTVALNSTYIDSWLKILKQPRNERLITSAASHAMKAADYIQGKKKVDKQAA